MGTQPSDSGLLQVRRTLPRVARYVEDGLSSGSFLGCGLVVTMGGDNIVDAATGFATPATAATPATMWDWRCAVKPVLAMALALLVQESRLSLDDEVASLLPAFAEGGKDRILVRNLLDNTSGLPAMMPSTPRSWRAAVDTLCAYELPSTWKPGHIVYSTPAWYVVAALIEEHSGKVLEEYVAERILRPLGMSSTILTPSAGWCGGGDAGPAVQHVERNGAFAPFPPDLGPFDELPGGAAWGPLSDLARFYGEVLRSLQGKSDLWDEFLVRRMLTTYPDPRHDCEALCGKKQFALGFALDMSRTLNGRRCSSESFGHGAAIGVHKALSAVADPAYGVTMVCVLNGVRPRGNLRYTAIGTKVYEDLGLVPRETVRGKR